jgi:hypothetical protein
MTAGAAVVVAGLALMSATVAVGGAGASSGQIVKDLSTTTATGLAQSLVGSGLTVSNVTFTGDKQAAGTFEMPAAATVGFARGVVLSSGRVADVAGPNDDGDWSTDLAEPGDDALTALVAHDTRDASVLEFDFVPTSTHLSFNYVFASEEYQEYVGSKFNDVFAFLVNGKNCAVIGAGGEPVAVNGVNHAKNTALYRDNPTGDHAVDLQFDGLTTVLTCEADVNKGAANHVKLAIADTSDGIYDAAVFLQTGSFVANVKPVAPDVTVPGTVTGPTPVKLAATDGDGDPLTYEVVDKPAHGTVTGTGPDLTYAPKAGFTGTDSFTYQASDGKGDSNTGTVTVQVGKGDGPGAAPTTTTTGAKGQGNGAKATTTTAPTSTTSTTTTLVSPGDGAGPGTPASTVARTAVIRQPAGELPLTGSRAGLMLVVGGGLVLAGLALMALRSLATARS